MMAAATVAAFWLFHVSEARSALRSIYSLLSFHLTKTIGLDLGPIQVELRALTARWSAQRHCFGIGEGSICLAMVE